MQALENFLSQFGAFNNLAADPRFQALIVVVLSFVVAKIADWVISRLITRWAQKTTTDLDDRIVEILKAAGVDIARRTVAKYREAMRIPSSVERRRQMKETA